MPRAEAKYTIRAEDKTRAGIRSAQTRLQRLGNAARNFATRFTGPLAVAGAAIAGVGAAIGKLTGNLDEAAKTAADFGQTASELEQYRVTASLLGTDLNTLLRIQERLANAAVQATEGVAEYADEFERLGINAETFAQLSLRGQLSALDVGLQGLSRTEATATRRALAGRGTGRVFRGNLQETFGTAEDVIDARGLDRAAGRSERLRDSITLLREAITQRLAAFTTRPIADAFGADRIVNAIDRLTDRIIDRPGPTESGVFRLEDEQIRRLESAVSRGNTYRR